MLHNQHSFVIPENQGVIELVSSLRKNFSVRLLAETVNKRVFYDTFDWRLYKNGSVLEQHNEGSSRKIYWREGRQGKLKIQLGLSKVPYLASELPAGEFRQQLHSVISVRELTPRVRLKIKRQSLAVVDNNEKIVVRLYIDKYLYQPSKTRAARALGNRLTIVPVKGYADDYSRVEASILEMKLPPAQDNMMKLALVAKGVSAGEYSSKLNILLDPDMPAEQALKKILLRLLEIMKQNTAGSITGRDIEFMHHYRVSIRKTRSALKQVKGVLPQDISEKYNNFFSMLGKLTNPVRDLDVFLVQLENYQQDLGSAAQQALQPLCEHLMQSRAEAQKKFVEELKSAEYRENIKQWCNYLGSSEKSDTPAENADRAVYKLADELIWEIYQQALEQGNAITADSKAKELHELRKTFKKLRYLIEFFRSLYPTTMVREFTQALTGLQDNLGELNDLDVHAAIVRGFIKQCTDEKAVKACKKIIKSLKNQLHKTRSEFAACYADFASADNHNRFREMFIDYHASR
ncbi:MAG: CHAD domain-containing protein [Gammaproteobacteria bacterium]|nr:CHAD domain-containing protein [Gammaproteobacteria bacterium]